MKTVYGRVLSSNPISLSKAASTLSSFLSTDNGASQAICAYLRRASASFNELKQLHKELSSRSDRKHRNIKSEIVSEVSQELSHRIEDGENKKSSVSESRSGKRRRETETNRDLTEDKRTHNVRSGQESSRGYGEDERVDGERHKDGKTMMVSGGTGNLEDRVGGDGKRRGELKIEIEDNPGRRVELDKESSDRDKSNVALESRRKKHKKKSDDEIGKIGDNEREDGARESDSRSRISDNNGVGYGVGVNERKLKIEVALVGSVELGQNLSPVIENNVVTGKDRKKYKDKEDQVDSEGQRRRDIEEEKSREDEDNGDGKVLMELPTKKKKKKKKEREQDVGDLQIDGGGAIEKEGMPVLDSEGLRGEGRKKRKNRDILEGVNYGSAEQQGIKRRKRNE